MVVVVVVGGELWWKCLSGCLEPKQFDPTFCQGDWSQALAPPPPHSPLSFPAPKSHMGTKAKVSMGWGCDAGLEGVDPL